MDVEQHEQAVGVEMEIGGTAGDTHEGVLQKTLGHERGLAVAIKRGPPPVRRAPRG